ncbi:MAG: epoxyqueuosine reductase [Asgard group archaeon]|nr:epoxyqueuosine reductase [Asgard group archaeon]
MSFSTVDSKSQKQLTIAVKERLIRNNASLVGIADLSILTDYGFFLPITKGFTRAISIVFKLSDDIIDNLIDGPTKEYANHYNEINAKLDELTTDLVFFLNNKGFNSLAIEASKVLDKETHSANFPHKTAAILSGIGWIGKSNLLITQEYGPRVRLATVLTNAPLLSDSPQKKSKCSSCSECVKICPV